MSLFVELSPDVRTEIFLETRMKVLGYSLTWRTHCFLSGGCGVSGLFGHTNGDGDFVLFDSLGWPWPIHECYSRRFELDQDSNVIQVRGCRSVEISGSLAKTWDAISTVSADSAQHAKPFSIIGTVTNVDRKFLSTTPGFRQLTNSLKATINQTFESCRDYIVVATGDGLEYGCFVDLDRTPVKFRDTVAIKLKAVRLLNKEVFISRNVKAFRFE